MPKLAFGAYSPDVLDLNSQVTRIASNAVPRGDGFGPFKSLAAFTAALAATARGYFVSFNPTDGSVTIFAGTATKLYKLNNTTLAWADVSKGAGTYTTIASDANWVFCQFGAVVIATQKNDVMQAFTIGSSAAFADLAGTPPHAGWVGVVGSFVVACDILNSPTRLVWCAFGDPTGWTAGTSLSDLQDMPDGGRVRCVGEIGNLVGVILQDNGIRRMVYAAGSQFIFQIQKLRTDVGILAPYSLAIAGGRALFLSTKGFAQLDVAGNLTFIGEERVDRSMLGQHNSSAPAGVLSLAYDSGAPQLVIGAADPRRNLYVCVYKSQAGQAGLFDRGFVYQWSLDKWGPLQFSGEYLAQTALPGLTLEALDALAPGAQIITGAANNGGGKVRLTVGSTAAFTTGDVKTISAVVGTTEANVTAAITVVDATHIDLLTVAFVNAYVSGGVVGGSIDAMTTSLDEISTSSLPAISGVNGSHQMGFFSGAALETIIETPEQKLEGNRFEINNLRPITDAPVAFGSTTTRETLQASDVVGIESAMDADGNCPLLDEGAIVRGRVRIPAGTAWNFAAGVEVDAGEAGGLWGF